MATSYEEITSILDRNGIKWADDAKLGVVRTGSSTQKYVDGDGDLNVQIAIQVLEDGEYVKFFVFNGYRVPPGTAEAAAFRAFLEVQWKTNLVRFEYDATDGEVRPSVELPLEDSPITERQVLRCLGGLVRVMDDWHEFVAAALGPGGVPAAKAPRQAAAAGEETPQAVAEPVAQWTAGQPGTAAERARAMLAAMTGEQIDELIMMLMRLKAKEEGEA
ncbi:MAG: hypothetical protein NT080_03905 [Spirochaetes bacterium]|nr:hypothetical protein [Spirochaetota bacterium]